MSNTKSIFYEQTFTSYLEDKIEIELNGRELLGYTFDNEISYRLCKNGIEGSIQAFDSYLENVKKVEHGILEYSHHEVYDFILVFDDFSFEIHTIQHHVYEFGNHETSIHLKFIEDENVYEQLIKKMNLSVVV